MRRSSIVEVVVFVVQWRGFDDHFAREVVAGELPMADDTGEGRDSRSRIQFLTMVEEDVCARRKSKKWEMSGASTWGFGREDKVLGTPRYTSRYLVYARMAQYRLEQCSRACQGLIVGF
nr:hypothetical protein CFP56_21858 [Quercus suber]